MIEILNWPALYSYKPHVCATLAYNDEYIFVKWHVEGTSLRAVHTEDLKKVSDDSCVEFFCQVDGDDHYFNFEFNCIGTMTASYRKGRAEDVRKLTPEELSQIIRYSSVGTEPFEEIDGEHTWQLCVAIPFSLLVQETKDKGQRTKDNSGNTALEPSNLRTFERLHANFYKCADQTSTKHYVSWMPIPTEKPDFHRPEFFGTLILS